MRKLYSVLGLTLLLNLSVCMADEPAPKADTTQTEALIEQIAEGKDVHTDSCTKCHDSSVYTKIDRKIQTLTALNKRVQACNINTGAGLDEEELEALTLFLNTSYYKFER